MYDTQLVARMDREIAAFLEEEYAAKGEDLYQWYRRNFIVGNNKALTSSIGLAPYDKKIVQFVLEQCPFAKRFVEVGAGLGQESILLGLLGMKTCAIEANRQNFDMMQRAVARAAERIDTTLPTRMTPINDWFPTKATEYVDGETILAFPTLSWSLDDAKEQMIFDALKMSAGVIFSTFDFFRHRGEPAERELLIEQIRKRGFAEPIEVHAWQGLDMGFRYDRIVFMKNLRPA